MQNDDETILKQVHAALECETRINVHRFPMQMKLVDGTLTLAGEVAGIAAKRLAIRLAGGIPGVTRVIDQITVVPADYKADGEILDALTRFLLRETDLRSCTLRRCDKGYVETLHDAAADNSCGEIEFSVADGSIILEGHVISLSHRRQAEILAWWVPGCRSVVNRLTVSPPEEDGDDEVTDAVRLALEMDPLIDASQIRISTTLGMVSLDGVIVRAEEREMAEYDAWCVAGVSNVINHLEVAA